MSQAIVDITAEREKQKANPAVQAIEAQNTVNDFVAYISAYAGRAATGVLRNEREGVTSRDMLVKAGALCAAAIDKIDSK
jgi:hypothetical protein